MNDETNGSAGNIISPSAGSEISPASVPNPVPPQLETTQIPVSINPSPTAPSPSFNPTLGPTAVAAFQAPENNVNSLEPTATVAGSFVSDAQPNLPLQTVEPGMPTPPIPPIKGKRGKKKLIFISVFVAFILLGGTAAAYVGYIAPNKPENVWKQALSNTSKGFGKLADYRAQNKDKSTVKADGTYKFATGSTSFDGSFSAEADQNNSKSHFDVGILGTRVNVDTITTKSETSTYPDIYLKVEGIKAFSPLISTYDQKAGAAITEADGQWYSIDHSLFDQLTAAADNGVTGSPNVNEENINAAIKTVGDISNKYLFSTDPNTAVLNASEYVAKEEVDGRQQHHYKVSVNKDNFKKYANELNTELAKSELFKSVAKDGKLLTDDEINKLVDGVDASYKADVWVDAQTKLIRTVRFTDKNNQKNYVDVGLKYNGGGTEFPFYIKVVGDDGSGSGTADFTATLNTKTNEVKLNMNVSGDTNGDKMTAQLDGKATFSNEPVSVDKPANAKSIMELIGKALPGASTPQDLGQELQAL